MTTRIQEKAYKAIEERITEIEKETLKIQDKAKSIIDYDIKFEYVLQEQPLMSVMNKEIILLKPLLDFYEDIDELNY